MNFKRETNSDGGIDIYADFLIGDISWRCYIDDVDRIGLKECIEKYASRDGVYFEICERECLANPPPHVKNVMFLHRLNVDYD